MPTVGETAKTAAPRRRAATTRKTTAKAAPAPAATEEESAPTQTKVGPFDLVFKKETANYVAFELDKATMGAVGTVYAPPGTVGVRVVFYGEDVEG